MSTSSSFPTVKASTANPTVPTSGRFCVAPATRMPIPTVAHDSDFDYDPVWRRCEELGVAPTFHASGQGWGTRMSRSNYVYNHIGNFAAADEASCRSIFFGSLKGA